MRSAGVTRGLVQAVRETVAAFLAISGVAAIVFGLLYWRASHALPHLARGHTAASRANFCLMAGSACVVAGWLLRTRRRDRG